MNSLYPFLFRKNCWLLFSVLLWCGCALEKKSGVNKSLQNLTAHYNLLFNAREIIRLKEETILLSSVDDYDQLLSVFQDTIPAALTPDKDLEEVIHKANKIIQFKEQSRYLGDAYFLLGQANYFNGQYFNAVEFFDYVFRNYPKQKALQQQALVWKARSLLHLGELAKADSVLDTAFKSINIKKSNPAIVYATRLQYEIITKNYPEAEDLAKKAISFSKNKKQRLRLTFILAQLMELNLKPKEAYEYYTKLTKSNISFEMAFHAQMNRIRIEDGKSTLPTQRIARLENMIQDDKNKDFLDQIYYAIGDLYLMQTHVEEAVKNYRLSINQSNNRQQTGLSYLRLADISFKNKADYTAAKKYYDSTLLHLPKNYPGYGLIFKKSNNLRVLAGYLQEIAIEDTLQMLSRLNETDRLEKIEVLINREISQEQNTVNHAQIPVNHFDDVRKNEKSTSNSNTFYFDNANAMGQGYVDFKQRWGDRKLEDNWRRSKKSSNEINMASMGSTDPDAPGDPFEENSNHASAAELRQELLQNIPITSEQLKVSEAKIIRAYLDMANLYKDVLEEEGDAILAFETVLKRFPENDQKASIYYNLYRLYATIDLVKSDYYKNLLIKDYPQTTFARVIVDPASAQESGDQDNGLNTFYNQVYADYTNKKYTLVITGADELIKQFPQNNLIPQVAYLRAIALGHQQKLDPFQKELELITLKYPDDLLITPLVKQHLIYIATHQMEIANRTFALMDNDHYEIPFTDPITVQAAPGKPTSVAAPVTLQPKEVAAMPTPENNPSVVTDPFDEKTISEKENIKTTETITPATEKNIIDEIKATPSLFSLSDSNDYYFAVNVSNARTNLASSRFGIGQFNRTHFQGHPIKHDLKEIGQENQLVYIGRFYNLNDVKDYARRIAPLLADIMKVPKDKYNFFIITRENLDKLADKKTLESYMDFYQNNY